MPETPQNPVFDHQFEQAGMGCAPYRVVGAWSPPSRAVLEANPAAYNAAMRDRPACCNFTCDYCGTPITAHFIVRDADGTHYAVGCQCVEKTNDSKLITAAEKERRRLEREKSKARRNAKREAERKAILAELDAQRERNGGLTDAEVRHQEIERKREGFRDACKRIAAPILEALKDQRGPFVISVSNDLEDGLTPAPKAQQIIKEIAARQHGRKGSKAYETAFEHVDAEYCAIFDRLSQLRREFEQ